MSPPAMLQFDPLSIMVGSTAVGCLVLFVVHRSVAMDDNCHVSLSAGMLVGSKSGE